MLIIWLTRVSLSKLEQLTTVHYLTHPRLFVRAVTQFIIWLTRVSLSKLEQWHSSLFDSPASLCPSWSSWPRFIIWLTRVSLSKLELRPSSLFDSPVSLCPSWSSWPRFIIWLTRVSLSKLEQLTTVHYLTHPRLFVQVGAADHGSLFDSPASLCPSWSSDTIHYLTHPRLFVQVGAADHGSLFDSPASLCPSWSWDPVHYLTHPRLFVQVGAADHGSLFDSPVSLCPSWSSWPRFIIWLTRVSLSKLEQLTTVHYLTHPRLFVQVGAADHGSLFDSPASLCPSWSSWPRFIIWLTRVSLSKLEQLTTVHYLTHPRLFVQVGAADHGSLFDSPASLCPSWSSWPRFIIWLTRVSLSKLEQLTTVHYLTHPRLFVQVGAADHGSLFDSPASLCPSWSSWPRFIIWLTRVSLSKLEQLTTVHYLTHPRLFVQVGAADHGSLFDSPASLCPSWSSWPRFPSLPGCRWGRVSAGFPTQTEISNSTAQQVTREEGNVLLYDALNTFYLRLYGVGLMVEDHSDSERGRKCFI